VAKDPEIHPEVDTISPLLLHLTELYRPRMESAGISFDVEIDESITLSYDSDRLKGVFVNLLENALDSGAHHLVIRGTRNGRFAEISLQDDGSGMEPAQVEQVFDLYYTTKQKGTGLGLAYVQRVVSAHGGFVQVESKSGVGTRFSVFLPLEEEL
jgi:signal transduction histidine kinase